MLLCQPRQAAPIKNNSFVAAINMSFASLVTASTDMAPAKNWSRFVTTLESIEGFVLITASVSWLLSLYPVLEHRASTAHNARSLYDAEKSSGIKFLTFAERSRHTNVAFDGERDDGYTKPSRGISDQLSFWRSKR